MKDFRKELFAIFQAEHAEHLERIRSILALLENVSEADGKAGLEEAFRRAHTLKGAARAVDLGTVEGLASGLESVFARVQEGALQLDQETAGVIHQVLNSSEDCMAAFREGRAPHEPEAALQAIDRLLGVEAAVEPRLRAPAAPEGGAPAGPTSEFQVSEMVRLPGEDLDRLVRSTWQILAESLRQEAVTEELCSLGRQIAEMEREWTMLRSLWAGPLRSLSGQPVLAPVARYLQFVEQKVRSLAGQSRRVRLLQQGGSWRLRASAGQLQRDVWSARLAPVEDQLESFRRMVRELARDQRKEIEFRVIGAGVRADRAVLQALKDPVMHLLRNAISHGIETPGERAGRGKTPAGLLTLRIESQRGLLVVEVDDDGRGVDLKAAAKVAIERGMLAPGDAATTSPQELERMIFRPGFSTSPTVNDLSGRGMGLSVVYEAAHRLRGEVNVRHKPGAGACIVLSVPLSVSTSHLLLVSTQGQSFGIPIHGIEQLCRVKARQMENVEGKPVVNLKGRQIPLFSLGAVLGIGDGSAAFAGDTLPVMLLRSGSKRAAVLVDEFVEEREALIQDLGFPAPPSGYVSGGVLMQEGTVLVVLNPVALLEGCKGPAAAVLRREHAGVERAAASILVVDDSITTRTLEKSILESQGYRVRVAVDGLEALQLLRAEKADLIVTDVQMPGLDGFGLLEALKADPRLDQIPVIVVSSLERKEERQRGLDLGARAYVVKRKFDQQELLDAIQQAL